MDIADVTPQIVENIKRNGQVRPTVFVFFEDGKKPIELAILNFMGDSRAKAIQLFGMGLEFGRRREHIDRSLREVAIMSEVWLTRGGRNPNPGEKPPAHMEQKEAVMLVTVQARAPFDQVSTLLEIERSRKGKAEGLKPMQDASNVEGLLFLSFLAGWRARRMDRATIASLQPGGPRAFLEGGDD